MLGDKEDLGITLALIPDEDAGRAHRAPASAAQRRVHERPELGQGRVRADGLRDRRRRVRRPGLEDADELPRRRALDFAAGANAAASRKLCALTTGAYGRVRQQFRLSIGRFEGVEEALARIGGNAYIMDAARVMTAGAVDLGEKPSVVSAIVKYHLTERGRQVINDAMDVHGGKGICMGPEQLSRARLPADADRDHGRGREHPDALA